MSPRNRERVPSFDPKDLKEFIDYETGGDLSRLSKRGRTVYDRLLQQKAVFYYTADEILLDMDSHLRFFEDWLEQRQTNT